MNTQRNQQGFTIIEVVLVLAIAALIFLMIFVALPALQASQRDTARKNDASIVSSAVTKFTSSERRTVRNADDNARLRTYVDDLDQYETSGVAVQTDRATNPTATQILVYPSSRCDGTTAAADTNTRKLAVRLMLDNGTNFYCVDAS